jgi:hypothetical protein
MITPKPSGEIILKALRVTDAAIMTSLLFLAFPASLVGGLERLCHGSDGPRSPFSIKPMKAARVWLLLADLARKEHQKGCDRALLQG